MATSNQGLLTEALQMFPRLFRGFITPRHGNGEWKEKEDQATEYRQLSCQRESSSTTGSFYSDKVFIRNVAPCVSRELLVSYLENVTGQNHIDLLYGDEPGDVLATFTRRIDFAKVKQRCQSKLLNERQLEVWRVPVSNSILVENFSPDTDPDHVFYYFETPRAKGGRVHEVKPTPDEKKFIVVFKDAKTTDGVLKTTHRLRGRELRVSLYVECLGPSGGRTEPYVFVPPAPVMVTEADDLKVCFLRHSADMLQSFNERLSEVHAQATAVENGVKVNCTLTESMNRVDLLAEKWKENVKRQLTIFFDSIRLQRIAVPPKVWEDVKKDVEKSGISCSDLVLTFAEECSFVVLGRCNTKAVAFEQIQTIIKVKTEEYELKKREVSDSKKLKKHHLDLIKLSSFLSDIRTFHTGLTVDISFEHREITFQGQPMAIRDAQVRMYDVIHSSSSKVVTSIPQGQRDLLATEKSHDAVMKRLEASGLAAAWECHSEGIVVYNLNKPWLDLAAGIIETSFKSEILHFNELSSKALEKSGWDLQKKMLSRDYHGLLVISRQKSNIFITAFCDIMPAVKGAIRTFVSENTIYTAVLELSPSRQKFLALFWEEKILPTAQKFSEYKVHITLQDDNRSILIRGTYRGVELVKRDFNSLSEQIICKEESITRQETVRYIASLKTTKELEAIACTCKCVVSLHPEKCEVKTVSTNQPTGSPQVYAVTGDITQLSVDAIVNAANSLMDHAGGLAGQVVAKGGREIQEECYRILKTRGKLSESDVLVSGPGKLPCKSIIHAVGPRYKGGNEGEKKRLQATVMECLKTASDLGYTSIALPAISSGNFGYPVGAATRVIVEAVTSFFSANNDTSIRDVRLVDIVPSTVRHFQTALYMIWERKKLFPTQQAAWAIKAAQTGGMSVMPITMSTNQPHESPRINAVIGDITQLSVDAIVNAANKKMNHEGGLAGQVIAKGGQEIQEECRRILRVKGGLSEGDVLVSGPGKLPCKAIIHAVGPRYKGGNKREEECLHATVMECLKTASDLGCTSIAIPAISSGNFGYPVGKATRVIVEAVTSFFSANHDSSIRDVRLVDILTSTVRHFQTALDITLDGSSLSSDDEEVIAEAKDISEWLVDYRKEAHRDVLPHSLSKQKNIRRSAALHFDEFLTADIPKSFTADIVEATDIEVFEEIQVPQKVCNLYIYAANQDKIAEFLKELTNFVDEHVVKTEVKDFEKLSHYKRVEICKKHNVELCTDTVPTVKGILKDVRLMEKETQSIVKEIESKQQESMIASLVCWYCLEVTSTGTRRIPFGEKENLMTEDAHQKNEDTVEFCHANGTVYVVNLKEMTRSAKLNPVFSSVKIMRNVKADWTSYSFLPETWEPQDKAELVKVVPLVKGCPEYNSVEANMMKTIAYQFRTSSTIISIKRIQNPELYKQYLARKTQIDIQNNGMQSEKTLWHGTSSDAIDNINLYGFNRSCCGKNATCFGLGVYFAVNSWYSMQDTYATRDFAGLKHMYQCKVLVGYSTRGYEGLKVLPTRQETVQYDSATDKKSKPSMYVIFHDSQAYPEYLITFQ